MSTRHTELGVLVLVLWHWKNPGFGEKVIEVGMFGAVASVWYREAQVGIHNLVFWTVSQ